MAHELNDSLHYLNMAELKALCERYKLPLKGNKVALIHRIVTFVQSGIIVELPIMPAVSRTHRGKPTPLEPHALMLSGTYKNDARTRVFFKTLIGSYFHFTAFGIDWLNERWFAGNPPTYAEFAEFWKKEYAVRKQTKASPKKEWAYINFTQWFLEQNPSASRDEIVAAWNTERAKHIEKVEKLLQQS